MNSHRRTKAASLLLVAGLTVFGVACADDDGTGDTTTGETTTTDGADTDE
ncbi:MAG TPA: hypothetical protein VGA69_06115 [Nitriliruptorales bacterium]